MADTVPHRWWKDTPFEKPSRPRESSYPYEHAMLQTLYTLEPPPNDWFAEYIVDFLIRRMTGLSYEELAAAEQQREELRVSKR